VRRRSEKIGWCSAAERDIAPEDSQWRGHNSIPAARGSKILCDPLAGTPLLMYLSACDRDREDGVTPIELPCVAMSAAEGGVRTALAVFMNAPRTPKRVRVVGSGCREPT